MAQQSQESFDRVNATPQKPEGKFTGIFYTNARAIASFQPEWIVHYTPDTTLIWVSEETCHQSGYPREVLLGHSWLHFIYSVDRQSVLDHLATLMPEQSSCVTRQRILFADGQVRWFDWTSRGIFDLHGRLVEIQAVGYDSVARQQAEVWQASQHATPTNMPVGFFHADAQQSYQYVNQQSCEVMESLEAAAKYSQERLHSLIEASSDWVWEVDENAVYRYASPKVADILGYQPEEVLGKSCFDLMPTEEAQRVASVFGAIAAARQPFRYLESVALHKDGHLVILETSGVPIVDSQGQFRGYRGMDRDITARKLAEVEVQRAKEAAEAANQVKSDFLANVSHELRSPLNAILGFSQMLALSQNLSPEQQEYVSIIHHSGDHLLNLISSILDLSKIEADCVTLNPSDFDLYRLLDDLKQMFCLRANEKHLTLRFDRTAKVPQYICADELKLRQVLINLLSNAIKFTRQGGVTLRVSATQPELSPSEPNMLAAQALKFEVEDTGIGIALESLDEIFNAFVQTPAGRDAGEGTGLGLSISRAYVQLMGGDISVSSNVGQGSTFRFDIQFDIKPDSAVAVPEPAENQDRLRFIAVPIHLTASRNSVADFISNLWYAIAMHLLRVLIGVQAFIKQFLRVIYT